MAQNKTKRKEYNVATIRRRLSAALVMLLISAVMLVTTTYAWFTLSTAPEARSIATNIAGNGSLEVALMPGSGLLGGINSGRAGTNGGGTIPVVTANNTWGNVVTLSDVSYGLSQLELRPAAMSIDADDGSIDFAIPEFGFDGRIRQLLGDNVSLNAFDTATNDFTKTASEKGVRAIVVTENNGTDDVITTYGYAIDLAFRINTADTDGTPAKLLLQQQAIQRIYNGEDEYESTASPTQGSGSYMRFANKPADSRLADGIKIAFIQNFGNAAATAPTLLAYGKIADGNGTLKLVDANGDDITGNVLLDEMTKNQAYQISVVVWLDGANLSNADFVATSADLMDATLNLQFVSDVTLLPAINTDLRENPPAGVVDTAALNAQISAANAIADAAESSDALTALETAIAAAEAVAADANATQSDVNDAVTALSAAVLAYNAAVANP